jgi:hypothetical protein
MRMKLDIPCKIGDEVWAIRQFNGVRMARKGVVSEMYFVGKEMKLCIVVKGISRGVWMRDIFPTKEDAEERLMRK